MAKTLGGVRGKYATQIQKTLLFYEQEKQKAYKEYDSVIRGLKSLTDKQYNVLSKRVSYFESHPAYGTKKELEAYINRNRRKMRTGDYKEGLMNMYSGLGGNVVSGMADTAALREHLPHIKDLLKRHRR